MSDKMLLGELKEFRKTMTADVKEIKKDVKALMQFKWKIIGFAGFAAFIATTLIELVRH